MKKNSDLKVFISYYKPYRLMFTLDLLAALVMSLIGIFYPIITRKIFNEYVPTNNVNGIVVCGCILLGVYIVRSLLKMFLDYYGHRVGVKMQADMRRDVFIKLESLPFSFYDEHEVGEIMSKVINDLNDVSELAHHGPENIFISSVTMIGSFVYLLTINWILAVILICCAPILFAIALVTRTKQLAAFASARKDVGRINASLENSLSGIRTTKAFNNSDKEIEHFNVNNEKIVKSRSRAYFFMSIFHSSTGFVIQLFNLVCVVGGALIVLNTNVFKIEDYLAFAVSISLFTQPIETLVQFMEQLQDGTTGFKRFMSVMREEPEKDKEGAIQDIVLKGNVEFKNVSFKYETSEGVLNNISFSIKKGETIALVGSSGGGKTTICHLIPHFYSINKGEILFDGINIDDISLKALRENIGIVQQDVFLFGGTIRQNIKYGKMSATEEEIIEAAKKANIYDYIMSLPNGFESIVGERGVKLSGGQKQRISIARVFLRNPSILILDEATSALDNTTEIAIQKSLNKLSKGRTSIIVAHRLSTIKNADRILVIENGKVKEEGTHEELLNLNKVYAKLYNEQFKI